MAINERKGMVIEDPKGSGVEGASASDDLAAVKARVESGGGGKSLPPVDSSVAPAELETLGIMPPFKILVHGDPNHALYKVAEALLSKGLVSFTRKDFLEAGKACGLSEMGLNVRDLVDHGAARVASEFVPGKSAAVYEFVRDDGVSPVSDSFELLEDEAGVPAADKLLDLVEDGVDGGIIRERIDSRLDSIGAALKDLESRKRGIDSQVASLKFERGILEDLIQ